MTPGRLMALVTAECLKLQSRPAARVGWVLLALVGVACPLMLMIVSNASVSTSGEMVQFDGSAANGARWALILRNFYVAQAFLILLSAQSLAGELQTHTLREDLVRAVPRWAVLVAKWAALCVWSGVALAVQWGLAVGVGLLFLEWDGDISWKAVLAGYAASWLTDVSFVAVALLAAAAFRTVASAIAGVFLFLILERFASWGLWMARGVRSSLPPEWSGDIPIWVDWALNATPWLPSSAWGVWRELIDATDPTWQSWAALGVVTLLAVVAAERIFARTDVP